MTKTTKVVRGFAIAYPTHVEAGYARRLLNLTTKIESFVLEHLQKNNAVLKSQIRQDDIVDDTQNFINEINSFVSLEVIKIIKTLGKRFVAVKDFTNRSFNRSLARLAKDKLVVISKNKAIASSNLELIKRIWIEKNTQLIKDIPINTSKKISDIIFEGFSKGESLHSLKEKIVEACIYTKSRAKIIARDQIAKLRGNLNRYNDLLHGFENYIWSSCEDGVVRKSHRILEGKICSWLDETIYKNDINEKWKKRSSIGGVLKHVGEDIMCRCTNIMIKAEVIK